MQVQATRMYRVSDVARMLDVSPTTIYRAIADGQLTAYKVGVKGSLRPSLRIPGDALEAFIKSCEATEADVAVLADESGKVA